MQKEKPLMDKCRVRDHFGPVAPPAESACISHSLVLLFLLVKHDLSSATLQLYFALFSWRICLVAVVFFFSGYRDTFGVRLVFTHFKL